MISLNGGKFEDLGDVPGDGLALAIRIASQVYVGGALDPGLELSERRALGGDDLVGRAEVIGHVDRQPTLGEVADMAAGRQQRVFIAQEPGQGPGLGRGLHYDCQLVTLSH